VSDEDFPDIEGGMRAFLRADAGVQTALGASQRVFFDIPDRPTWPLVAVSRIGGGVSLESEAPVDEALISFDCWGELDGNGRPRWRDLWVVVNAVRSALFQIRGRTTLTTGVDVFGANVVGVVRAPDPDNGRPRYTVTAEVIGISS
jgi:hypothetical protein